MSGCLPPLRWGTRLILACGTLWLATLTHASLHTALSLGALPFLAGDTIKVLLAASLAAGVFQLRAKRADPNALNISVTAVAPRKDSTCEYCPFRTPGQHTGECSRHLDRAQPGFR